MSDPKKYDISSFDRLCNAVNTENAERLALDLSLWLLHYAHAVEQIRKADPKNTKGKPNTKIIRAGFEWTDDGINEITGTTIINNETGEITK